MSLIAGLFWVSPCYKCLPFLFSERISDEAGGGRSKSNNNVILNRERGLYLNIKAELNNYKENVQTFEKGNKVH